MGKVFIQGKTDSHLGSHIYVVYDRKHKHREQQMWLGSNMSLPIPEIVWFYSEPEAREWISNEAHACKWIANSSIVFILELPTDVSTMILLDDDPSKRLQEELTISEIERLWSAQYANEVN